jgi:predicted amidohydrolase
MKSTVDVKMSVIEPYFAAVIQAERIAVRAGGMEKFRENIQKNLERFCGLIDYCCAGNLAGRDGFAIAGPVKLITFGEFAITGLYSPAIPGDHRFGNAEINKYLAISIPGPETSVLAAKATQYRVYIAAANIEADPDWPDFHFNTGFIINPEGKIILKYRKTLTNNPVEIACSAHDIMDKYRNPVTGKYDPFPVVDTSIGRLALMICADLASPEIPRIYSMKGAEVVMHLTSGNSYAAGGPRPIGVVEAIKRTRAADNAIYFINSNWGPEVGAIYPRARIAGHSAIVSYTGEVLAEAEDSSEIVVRARLNIQALRQFRRQYYKNPVTQVRSELYAPYYSKPIYPPNTFLKGGPIQATLDKRQQELFAQAVNNLLKCEDFYYENDIAEEGTTWRRSSPTS